ncbi:MAG TPA: Rne/Rng family ribonuclease [Nocardioides sp.]|uniref:Rne/Rng family ribonuclease n=1 Tax=Nocardioides sp. TaxID=35761 RepID=UPI002E3003DD|nr:Rne/Rng family ribonuclease [Nocardioides sp.]HEX5090611.1 Rne/Rng family ribonuclease [Nocardioides sp.]
MTTRLQRTRVEEQYMPEDETTQGPEASAESTLSTVEAPAKKAAAKKAAAKKATAKKATAKKATAKKAATKKSAVKADETVVEQPPAAETAAVGAPAVLFQVPDPVEKPAKKAARKTSKKAAAADAPQPAGEEAEQPAKKAAKKSAKKPATKVATKVATKAGTKAGAKKSAKKAGDAGDKDEPTAEATTEPTTKPEEPADAGSDAESGEEGTGGARRRRRRGGRRRRKSSGEGADSEAGEDTDEGESSDADDDAGDGSSRRRRRRRRAGEDGGGSSDDPQNTVTRVRRARTAEDQITAVSGSTRLEAKKQRRREGREAGRRRAPIVSEAEFLARRESVERVMVVRQRDELTQIGVLEDKVLVEHYVARESQTSLIGNVYLGRVQNVLPSMEAAFIDIGRGRNAVLYAGEVNWSALGHKDGQPRKIESVLSSGQSVLVQVTKDPIGHKGARLTSQVSLAGRFLVYVPDGTTSGISRKLPDTERNRLKTLLKELVPDTAGVIVRTAAEGASEAELTSDVERLKARWEDIEKKAKGSAPQLLYGEPDLTLKVVRDLFTEDFSKLVIQGDDAWETVQAYVAHVAPDLEERLERYDPEEHGGADLFATYRLDEQIAKGLDRKVWLPSGGSLIIDRTEAMTVVDVNTGKFTGSGGNLEETVTKNNLEAAEEIVRQLRLRDIGGIIVVDFIDMVLESNRDLVLRRLVECLGRDRTRHQVAEVTSLGLVQMTRKRIGTGLLEAFSETCEHCQGRGLVIHEHPVEPKRSDDEAGRGGRSRRGRGGRGRGSGAESGGNGNGNGNGNGTKAPSPIEVAAMARQHEREAEEAAAVEDVEGLEDAGTEVEDDLESLTSEVVESVSDEVEDEAVDEPAAAPEPEPEPEPGPEPAAVPEKPTVVTRTRRRSASRPAGPPRSDAVAVPAMADAPASIGTEREGSVGAPAADGVVEPGTAEEADPGAPAHVEHVPIKRKGSRKR